MGASHRIQRGARRIAAAAAGILAFALPFGVGASNAGATPNTGKACPNGEG